MALAFFIVIALLSLGIIFLASKYLIESISRYARTTGFSDYIIGFLVVAIGTSLPDLSTAVMSALASHSELSLGNVIGANIIDVTLILGITLILMKSFRNKEGFLLGKAKLALYIVTVLPLAFGLDGNISRADGAILLAVFLIYSISLLKKEHEGGQVKKDVNLRRILVDMLVFLFALGSLLLGSRYLVHSCIQISSELNIPLFFIGLIFISLANTAPEIFIGVKAAMSSHGHLSFGNIFGSIVINTTLVIGISAMITPILFDMNNYLLPLLFSIVIIFIASLFFTKRELNYKHGIFFILLYVLYIALVSLKAFLGW